MAMLFDIETGHIDLSAAGPNAFIKRKDGKKVNIPPVETETDLISEFQKTKDNKKIEKFRKDYPKLMEGDTIISGAKTKIHIDISYNKGKDKPIDDYKSRASKGIFMGPNSELQVSGFESWDKTDAKTKERHHGELIKNVELKKGFFQIGYSHTEDILTTPVALIKFNFDGNGFFDVSENAVYSAPTASTSIGAGGVEYTNKLTKKTFTAKSSTFEEIIVTRDGIYRKGLTNMDDIFQNQMALLSTFHQMLTNSIPTIDPTDYANQIKNLGNNLEQGVGSMEMMKNMSPDDLTRLMKQGGAEVTPEIMAQMKELPNMLKMMEDKGLMAEMKKGLNMMKGFTEGMGNENIDRFAKTFAGSMAGVKTKTKELTKTSDGKSYDDILENPRTYKPLTEKFGAVKVG
ncbi:MAG: hypothetical protein PHH82_00695 [Candidatus ainarchaeum sp.]|nr:hypothetical protein [Candidatus ainarchaeum sp.]